MNGLEAMRTKTPVKFDIIPKLLSHVRKISSKLTGRKKKNELKSRLEQWKSVHHSLPLLPSFAKIPLYIYYEPCGDT